MKKGVVGKKNIQWKVLVISFLIVFSTAAIGSLFTSKNIDTDWYKAVTYEIEVPGFVFPIVWNILFFLMSLSLYLAWTSSKSKQKKKMVGILFGINLFLNMAWSYVFFVRMEVFFAFIEIIFLLASIVSLLIYFYGINKKSSWLLFPYFLWVSFATYLNYLMAF